MLINHLGWEEAGLSALNINLLGLETSQLLNTFVDISRDEVLIASVKLGVSLLNEGNPELMWVLAVAEHWLLSLQVDWNSLVYNNVNPLEVLEESENIETN